MDYDTAAIIMVIIMHCDASTIITRSIVIR
jgi:hypothetical protein